jgi:Arc/MetJ family transcription regulator
MRTTIDIPDALMARVKQRLGGHRLTFRSLVITALEDALREDRKPFRLRDASCGMLTGSTVSSAEINNAIDEQRDVPFQG